MIWLCKSSIPSRYIEISANGEVVKTFGQNCQVEIVPFKTNGLKNTE